MIKYQPLFEQKKLNNQLIIMGSGNHKYPMYVNPTQKQFEILLDRYYDTYPDAPKGNIKIRSTYSKNEDEFQWMSGDATHYEVEAYIKKRFGLETNQAWVPK